MCLIIGWKCIRQNLTELNEESDKIMRFLTTSPIQTDKKL